MFIITLLYVAVVHPLVTAVTVPLLPLLPQLPLHGLLHVLLQTLPLLLVHLQLHEELLRLTPGLAPLLLNTEET